ncbi:hypothetical protein C9374_010339 [Naegleria lovaniensis]|uniref:Uncharacterized protein n=1 Tax=Naegleria lovaniensis TaxID=51637 RepID=A0AA88GGC5_NAELO|nr:uncharacterized protein C9374_010339 [Naegleria lovaniensis]KAG2374965.1 hypothetical protein C9374_010339 [Naegleria lovaniensis]
MFFFSTQSRAGKFQPCRSITLRHGHPLFLLCISSILFVQFFMFTSFSLAIDDTFQHIFLSDDTPQVREVTGVHKKPQPNSIRTHPSPLTSVIYSLSSNYSVMDDLDFTFHLPICPTTLYINPNTGKFDLLVQAPSTFSMYIVIAVMSLLFASIVFSSYNSVFLPHVKKRIRTSSISNTLWIVYFLLVALRAVLNAVHFGKPTELKRDNRFLYGMTICGMLMHSLSALFLTLSLNYQRKHRSGFALKDKSYRAMLHLQIAEEREEERMKSTFQRNTTFIRKYGASIFWTIFSFEAFATLCFVFSVIAILLRALHSNNLQNVEIYKWLQFSAILFQRVPIAIISILIIFNGLFTKLFKKKNRMSTPYSTLTTSSELTSTNHTNGGPTILTRLLILMALLLNIPNDIPLSYWNYFIYGSSLENFPRCLFHFASIFDCILLLFFFSLVLWLFVMIIEFRRYRKETVEAALSDTVENFE